MAEYKLSPVRKFISKKVKSKEGASKQVLEISNQLGMLSKEELSILIKLKTGEKVDLSEKDAKNIIHSLVEKGLIVKN